jgi:hypothetical protein
MDWVVGSSITAMVPHENRSGMRPLRQLPQLPQNGVSCSKTRGSAAICVRIFHFGRSGALEPLLDLFVAKTPLAAELDGGYLAALGPQTNGSRGDTQPPGYGSSSEKGFCDGHFLHRIPWLKKITSSRRRSQAGWVRLRLSAVSEKYLTRPVSEIRRTGVKTAMPVCGIQRGVEALIRFAGELTHRANRSVREHIRPGKRPDASAVGSCLRSVPIASRTLRRRGTDRR